MPAVSVQGQDSEPAGSVPLTVQGGPIRMLPASGKLSIGELIVYNIHWGICGLLLLGSPPLPHTHALDLPMPSPPYLALSNPFSHLPTSSLFPLSFVSTFTTLASPPPTSLTTPLPSPLL